MMKLDYCKEYDCWVEEIEDKTGYMCPAIVFGEGCKICQNLIIVKEDKKCVKNANS